MGRPPCLPSLLSALLGPGGGQNEHRIAEGVETVLLADRLPIQIQQAFPPHQSAHQHQQTRSGQVEIGNQTFHHPPLISWVNKQIGLTPKRL